MSDELPENGNGTERATVALVNAKVATVDAKLDGVTALLRSEFADIRGQLEDIAVIRVKVDGLNDRMLINEGRLTTLERWKETEAGLEERRKSYRTVHLPSLLIALAGLLVAVLALLAPSIS